MMLVRIMPRLPRMVPRALAVLLQACMLFADRDDALLWAALQEWRAAILSRGGQR